MKIIPLFEPVLFQLPQCLHAEKPEYNMQDLTGVFPLAIHISIKPGQDYWLYVCNLTDVIKEQYSLTFEDSSLELLPQFCFRSYRKETRVRLHLLKDLLTSQASLAGILQTAAPFHSAMLYVCFPDPTWSVAIKSVYLIYKTCWNVVPGKKSQVHETSIVLRSRGQQITLFWQKYFSVLFIIQVCLS